LDDLATLGWLPSEALGIVVDVEIG